MKKTLLLITILILSGYGCSKSQQEVIVEQQQKEINSLNEKLDEISQSISTSDVVDGQSLKVEDLSNLPNYRQECQKEWVSKGEVLDNLVQSIPNITKEQAQNLGKRAGIVDENGYVIDEDIWVKNCMVEKKDIFE